MRTSLGADMNKTLAISALLILLQAQTALAADCVIHIRRTACSGKQQEAFKKCAGKAECDMREQSAASDADCIAAAMKACDNPHVDITKYQAVTAKFKSAELIGGHAPDGATEPLGGNFCASDQYDLNRCR